MFMRRLRVLMGMSAVFVRRFRVSFGLIVLALLVVMRRRVMVVRRRRVMGCRLMMVLV